MAKAGRKPKFTGCTYPDCDNCPYGDCLAPQSYLSKIDKETKGKSAVVKRVEEATKDEVPDTCFGCVLKCKLQAYSKYDRPVYFCFESMRVLKRPGFYPPPSWCKKRRHRV